jgi:hypothetical protein
VQASSAKGVFDNLPADHPQNDVGVPVVRKESKIRILDERGLLSKVKTPVFIQLEDGTRLYMTRHEFERIKGEKPALGKTLVVTFQRNLVDKTDQYSQIDSVICR